MDDTAKLKADLAEAREILRVAAGCYAGEIAAPSWVHRTRSFLGPSPAVLALAKDIDAVFSAAIGCSPITDSGWKARSTYRTGFLAVAAWTLRNAKTATAIDAAIAAKDGEEACAARVRAIAAVGGAP